jgi:hypothetical protein
MESIEAEVCSEVGKSDRKGRRVLGREEWYRLMGEYDRSGLTQEGFSEREGINYYTFIAWLGRRKREGGEPPADSGKFHEISLNEPVRDGRLEVILPDGTVVRGEDASALSKLVRLLRG